MNYANIIFPQKSIDDLLECLQQWVTITEINLSDFSQSFTAHLAYNAVHAITNQEIMVDEDSMEFVCYKVEKAVQNDECVDILKISNEAFVYVIIEKKTGYILSNSNKLYLKLVIERGVTQADMENHTLYMKYYLNCLKLYQNNEF